MARLEIAKAGRTTRALHIGRVETLLPPGARFETVRANALDFEVLCAGTGDRLALCLHGFPEHAISWRNQIAPLVALGYRVWAPNQRGYGRTTRPSRMQNYSIENLLGDIAALIDASGARSVMLVGHDWGAALAWFFAIRRTRSIERLVIMNVPHPAVFARTLRNSWRQRARSWYVAFFQLPRLPEALLGAGHARAIGDAFTRTAMRPELFTPELLAIYRDQAAAPGALTAMLNWYRAGIRGGGLAAQAALGFPKIDVPTLMLWGENDFALGKETTYGTQRYVPDLHLHYLPGVSHWVQQDAPERVNELLGAFAAAP